MTRTGLSPRLSRHRVEPLVEIHPVDALAAGLAEGDFARVGTPQGDSLFRVTLTTAQRPREIFVPIHWTDRQATGGRAGLLPRSHVDPHSGQPGFKSTPARLDRVATDWQGFLLLRDDAGAQPDCLWSTRVTVPGGVLFEVAGTGDPARLEPCLPKGERVEARDDARGSWRVAVLSGERLAASLAVTRSGGLPSREWLIDQLAAAAIGPSVIAGRAPGEAGDRGETVCVCFDVRSRAIASAIVEQRLCSVAEIGTATRAGTNCGSCRPALARILSQHREVENVAA